MKEESTGFQPVVQGILPGTSAPRDVARFPACNHVVDVRGRMPANCGLEARAPFRHAVAHERGRIIASTAACATIH